MASALSRRQWLKATGLAGASFCAGLTKPWTANVKPSETKSPSSRPSIIFILADDLGYADVGCYGQKKIQTPCIDRLAQEGTRFTSAYAGSSVCAPSRCVLMTGLHAGHARVRHNFAENKDFFPDRRVPLQPQDVTVAEVLKQAGYATGICGKWGLGEPGTAGIPNRQGFDEWLGYLNQDHALEYFPDYLWRNEEKIPLPGNEGGKKGQYSQDLFVEFALDFIRRCQDRPFFLYLAWCLPHHNYEIPSLGSYDSEDWPEETKTFAAMVARLDADVGRVAALLDELGLGERVVVFCASDNGSATGWRGMFDSCGPFRGKKQDLLEGGLRVPLIVRWPGHTPAGAVSDAPWHFADFLPTAAALASAEPPPNLDGLNTLPALLGQPQDLADRFLYWECPMKSLQQAVRWRNWKALRKAPDQPLQLYDLDCDLGEANDVSAQHPEVAARIEQWLRTARTESPYWPMKKQNKSGKEKKAGAAGGQKPAMDGKQDQP